jgi:hypothetical protein
MKKIGVVLAVACTAAAAAPAAADSGKDLGDFAKYGKKRSEWSPLQQYKAMGGGSTHYAIPALIMADELGDRLSQAGRLAVIYGCLGNQDKGVRSAALWAICSADVEVFDVNALDKELQQEGLSERARKSLLEDATRSLKEAKEIGAAVTAAAKDDPGVAALVDMGKTARDEWSAFASAHADQLADLAKLQDLVHENKNGLAGDCVDKTRPAMEKVVRATKWREQDNPVDPNYFYVNLTPATTDAFIATLAWGACVALTHESGTAIYAAAATTSYGYSQQTFRRYFRRGPRTLTYAKLYQEPFKPKFAQRDLSMKGGITAPNGNYEDGNAMKTPHVAVIAKLVKNGDETTIKFAKDKVMECVDWQSTNKVQSVTPNGDVMYEKKCMRRQAVANEYSDVVTATAFTTGLAPGVQLTEQLNFPMVGTKGGKFVTALGIKL